MFRSLSKKHNYLNTIKSHQHVYGNILVGLSFMALTFLTVKTFAPDIKSNAETLSAAAGSSTYAASISTSDATAINITPTSTQTTFTGQNSIAYTNACPYGFTVSMSTSSDNTGLERTGIDNGPKSIPTISSGTTLADNTWGYSADNGETYNPIPSLSSPAIIINTTSANTDPLSLNLTYGVRVNNSIPAGVYSKDVIYTVAVRPQCIVYDLKWNLNGGTGASGVSYDDAEINFGRTLNLQDYKPTRNGYTFTGWKSSVTNNTFSTDSETVDVNPTNAMEVTLTAQWTPVNYTISYTLNGGSATNPTSYNIETSTITLTSPTRTGYTFAGWTGSNGSTKQTTVTIAKGSTGDKSYTANWTPVNYTISYTMNGGSCSSYTNNYTIETNTFSLCTPTRNGYTFTGWSGTGLSGSTNKSVTIPKGSTGNRSYTANWQGAGILSISNMQDMTSALCSASAAGITTTLKDTRDNNTYTVAKLNDGKCWMTQNLRIINKTISSTDSNLPSGSTWTVPASNISSFTTAYNTNAAYYDSTYGGYYSFYTATAGWGTDGVTSGSSTKDICPKGWRLPTGGSSGEFQTLYNNYNSSALMQGVPGFVLSGYVSYGSVSSQGSYGHYWSSTVGNANRAYRLYLDSSNVFPANYYLKFYGFSVRCVAI